MYIKHKAYSTLLFVYPLPLLDCLSQVLSVSSFPANRVLPRVFNKALGLQNNGLKLLPFAGKGFLPTFEAVLD